MKIIKVLLILFSIVNILSIKEFSHQDNQDSNCRICQKVVYQLKFDKMADCGKKACKNTVNSPFNLVPQSGPTVECSK